MPRWFRIALRWVLIVIGTFLLTFLLMGVFGAILVPVVVTHGGHVHAWMLWAITALSFVVVFGLAQKFAKSHR